MSVRDRQADSHRCTFLFDFSGPYRRVRPAKLTNDSARTKRYNNIA